MPKKPRGGDPEPETVETPGTNDTENTAETPGKTEAPEAGGAEKKPAGKAEPTADELLAEEKDKYIRLYAEYENYRKRSARERESLYSQVKADTVTRFLPVYDNLERAIKTGCSDEAFLKGVEMTMTQLENVLEGMGVKPIDAIGKPFDANLHNAVMHVDDPDLGENTVAEEFQKGFTLGDRVIRFSMVKVAN